MTDKIDIAKLPALISKLVLARQDGFDLDEIVTIFNEADEEGLGQHVRDVVLVELLRLVTEMRNTSRSVETSLKPLEHRIRVLSWAMAALVAVLAAVVAHLLGADVRAMLVTGGLGALIMGVIDVAVEALFRRTVG